MSKIELKCGKVLVSPALFINTSTKPETQLLKKTINLYPMKQNHDGLNQIDGVVVSLNDFHKVSPFLSKKKLKDFGEGHYSIDDRVLVIDPSIYFLFMGGKTEKEHLCSVVEEWIPNLWEIVDRIGNMKARKEKIRNYMKKIYPLLDAPTIQRFLEFQIRNRADILIAPSVPLTSPELISDQIEKMSEMNQQSRILLNTVLSRYKDQRDLMSLVALNLSVLKQEFFEAIKAGILRNRPEIIGIRLMNLDENKTPEIELLVRFLKELASSKIPIFIFNVRESGYVALGNGASVITMPIAKSPYTPRTKGDHPRVTHGKYYHPIDMVDYPYKGLPDQIRSQNYRFPCHCEICETFVSYLKVKKSYWNQFRKVHFLLIKNMEIKELRESEVPLKVALKDKFARSKKTVWLPFLE